MIRTAGHSAKPRKKDKYTGGAGPTSLNLSHAVVRAASNPIPPPPSATRSTYTVPSPFAHRQIAPSISTRLHPFA
jgi:hypothetical protein